MKKKLGEKAIAYQEVNSVEKMLNLGITEVPVMQYGEIFMNFKEAVDWVNQQ